MTGAAPEDGLPPLREVIRTFGLDARKSLGQHFLLDGNLLDRIVRAAGDLTGINVIEVGPGPGGLTRALLASGSGTVTAVERDQRCIAALQTLEAAYPGRFRVVADDATETDLTALAGAPRVIVANLPYNVSTMLLLQWLAQPGAYLRMILMFQREVADRLAARPGSKSYGRLSVMAQWRCVVRPLFNVSKQAFTPPPNVASTIVELTPRAEPLAPADAKDLEAVTQVAFGQRRKMLRASLRAAGLDPEAAGIDGRRRAEDLSVEEFCVLARAHHAAKR